MNEKDGLGQVFRIAGVALLFASALVYMLAVDRTWYAVDGAIRLAAESRGLLRWRFVSHVLGLSNGGMRSQSWAFLAFPAMFWAGIALVIGAFVSAWRTRGGNITLRRAAAALGGRGRASPELRRSRLMRMKVGVAVALAAASASIAVLRDVPSADVITKAQLDAGALRMRLVQMGDGQRLMAAEDSTDVGSFGDIVSATDADALVRADAAERQRAAAQGERDCAAASNPDECRMLQSGAGAMRRTLVALTKEQVAERTASRDQKWQAVLAAFDHAALLGGLLSLLSLGIFGIVAVAARGVVADEFRGLDPEAEDPLYPAYTRFAFLLLVLTVPVALASLACDGGEQPYGVASAIVATTFTSALALAFIGRHLLAPRMLARVRNPLLAAPVEIGAHDREVLKEAARLDATASTKQHYAATLHAAASPAEIVTQAIAEAQHAKEAADAARARLLGPAFTAARARLDAATARRDSLRAHGAPPEAFGPVIGAEAAARSEIAELLSKAGWKPWPMTSNETSTVARPVPTPAHVIGAGILLGTLIVGVAIMSRPEVAEGRHRNAGPDRSSAPIVHSGDSDRDCERVLDQYRNALVAARDSAAAVERGQCSTDDGQGHQIPPAQLTSVCDALWKQHVINTQRVIDINARARAACPSATLAAIGDVPPALRVLAPSNAATPACPSGDRSSCGEVGSSAGVTENDSDPKSHALSSVTVNAVQKLVASQVSSISASGNEFVDTFDDLASAWLPDSLTLAKGKDQIAARAKAALRRPTRVESSTPIVGVDDSVGWATAQWKVTTADGDVIIARVTEVFATRRTGLRVIAASLSVAPSRGAADFRVDAAATADDYPNDFDGPPAQWLGNPRELAKNVRDDPATAVVGSDASEIAIGPAAVQKLLLGWRKLSLSPLGGEVGVEEEANYAIYMGVLRTPGANPLAYQTLALFTRRGSEDRFLLAAAHFSVPQRR